MIIFRPGDEQYAIAQAAPGFGFWAAMIGPHDHVDTGFFRCREHFRPRTFGVIGIFGVDVQDGAVIVIDTGERRVDALLHPFDALRVRGFQMFRFQALQRRERKADCGYQEDCGESHDLIILGSL